MDQQTGQQQLSLSPYRVLDLTEGECLLAGRMMGDLGADVIQIERPGGSPSRNRGPFYKDIPDPEKSLFWFGFCLNKRSITLDIETADGQDILRKLVASAHFVFESFEPGYLDRLDLGYEGLSRINPGIILASITPFGQTGPKALHKWSELIGWASSGTLYPSGDPDRAPSVPAVPIVGQQGALAAVLGALTAHWHRRVTGQGQQVDVSIQDVMEWNTLNGIQWWDCKHIEVPRVGWGMPVSPTTFLTHGYPCKDGYSHFPASAGALWMLRATRELHQWMADEGMEADWLKDYDWANFDLSKINDQQELARYLEPVKDFLATKTKAELWQAAVERRTLTGPVRDFKDNFEDPHLKDREFWVDIAHPELGQDVTYPISCFKLSNSSGRFTRAPLIGEHNQDIYGEELGLSEQQMTSLRFNRVI